MEEMLSSPDFSRMRTQEMLSRLLQNGQVEVMSFYGEDALSPEIRTYADTLDALMPKGEGRAEKLLYDLKIFLGTISMLPVAAGYGLKHVGKILREFGSTLSHFPHLNEKMLDEFNARISNFPYSEFDRDIGKAFYTRLTGDVPPEHFLAARPYLSVSCMDVLFSDREVPEDQAYAEHAIVPPYTQSHVLFNQAVETNLNPHASVEEVSHRMLIHIPYWTAALIEHANIFYTLTVHPELSLSFTTRSTFLHFSGFASNEAFAISKKTKSDGELIPVASSVYADTVSWVEACMTPD